MADRTDNSGMGVIVGILIAVLLVVGGYFFMKKEGVVSTETTNIEMPDVNVDASAPAPAPETPAPAAQ